MHYDVIIIGASMSGLAAGIRLAHFDKSVCIVERHYAFGGLNSYYRIDGRDYDVGLHAVTNYAPPDQRSAPLNKLLRQLRLSREDFDLHEQLYSEVCFPGRRLRFSNGIDLLADDVAVQFPRDVDNFRRFVAQIEEYDDTRLDQAYRRARPILGERFHDPLLIEMLLCPIMFYGCPQEHDVDFTHFVTMFKALFLQGFARPRAGVRTIIKTLVRRFRACGGKVRMRCPVQRLETDGGRIAAVALESGEILTADVVLSSAGYPETMRLCSPARDEDASAEDVGRISFVESIAILDVPPAKLGHESTIVFFNDAEEFVYAIPDGPVDATSGVLCCPDNYEGHEDTGEGTVRLTSLANPDRWMTADEDSYVRMKRCYQDTFVARGEQYIPGLRDHIICTDVFTPRTIHRFTGRINGAVYGSPRKRRDGRTPFTNLFVCGTDQGFLGIIGAMLSGITIANLQVLSRD